MDGSYVLTNETTKKTDSCIFCQRVQKSEYFSSTSTGKEKLIDLPNILRDGFVIERYNWFKCYTVSF